VGECVLLCECEESLSYLEFDSDSELADYVLIIIMLNADRDGHYDDIQDFVLEDI
jgi:hypothetical protein